MHVSHMIAFLDKKIVSGRAGMVWLGAQNVDENSGKCAHRILQRELRLESMRRVNALERT